ncbi:MAG: class F sortase [Nocardioides sp.]
MALVVTLLLMAVALLVLPPDDEPPAARPTATAEVPTAPTADKRLAPGDPPDRLVVPAISLDAPLVPIEVKQDGSLDPPSDTDIVGWWQRSAHPGQMPGQTVITGHTVHTGGGVMNELGDLQRGEEVEVHDDGRVVTYRVTEVFVYTREEVAANAQGLFGQDRPGGRLVLVTCTDWNGSSYDSNIIVYGEPLAIEKETAPAG